MKRLIKENKNTPEEYNRIFIARKEKGVDEFDLRRWKNLLSKFKGGRLIDLGCLDSLVPILAHKKYPKSELWGIDIAGEAINEMRSNYSYVYYEKMDVYETKFPTNYFSYAVAGEILEHLEKPKEFIKEAVRIVKSKGILAISIPLDEAKELGAVDAERHIYSFDEKDIREMLAPYCSSVEVKILRSIHKPEYKYCWPQLIVWGTKK